MYGEKVRLLTCDGKVTNHRGSIGGVYRNHVRFRPQSARRFRVGTLYDHSTGIDECGYSDKRRLIGVSSVELISVHIAMVPGGDQRFQQPVSLIGLSYNERGGRRYKTMDDYWSGP